MAENEDGAEKTHDPTPKRKEKAREEGQVVTSKEMFVFASLGTGVLMLTLFKDIVPQLGGVWAGYLMIERGQDLDALVFTRLGDAWRQVLLMGLYVAVPVAAAVLLLQAGMGGIQFAPKALGFKPDKINPMSGLARMVSKQALVELVKSVLKVSMLGFIAFGSLYGMLPQLDRLWASDAGGATSIIMTDMALLLGGMAIVLAMIGAIDLFWNWYSMNQKLMMTFKEVKDEAKEANGSPEIKGKIRQLQMEMSRRGSKERAALADVPNATAIVTNPQHFAVAMRYVPGETSAPVVLASGKGHIAQEIKKIGAKAGIDPIEAPILARALYFTTPIGTEIDERLFAAVAALLSHVWHLDNGFASDVPDFDLPPELRLNEFGRPLDKE